VAKGRIGLDIGSTAVRAAELSAGTQPTVVRAAQGPLPAGAVENGEVREPLAVSSALRELWKRGGFSSGHVWLGVGNQRVVVREIALPFLPEKELKASLSLQVQEFIPMPVDEAVLDYDPIGEFEQDDRKMLRMLLVAGAIGTAFLVAGKDRDAVVKALGVPRELWTQFGAFRSLGPGAYLVVIGGLVGILGGLLTMAWARSEAEPQDSDIA